MYGIAVKQIINAIGNTRENSTKENVVSQYVEKIMNVVSSKTLRNKLRSLQFLCGYNIDDLSIYPNSAVLIKIIQNFDHSKKCLPNRRMSLKGKCNTEDTEKRLHDAVEQLTTQNIRLPSVRSCSICTTCFVEIDWSCICTNQYVWLPHGEKSLTCANVH